MDLIGASTRGNLIYVKYLLFTEVDPNIVNENGQTPLFWASHNGHLDVVKELLRAEGGGADPNIADKESETPLFWASRYGRLEVVKELLTIGADPNIADVYNQTPLFLATRNEHFQVIELLETYFPSLLHLSLRTMRKFKINTSSIHEGVLE